VTSEAGALQPASIQAGKRRMWTAGELEDLRAAYSTARNSVELDLAGMALRLGRSMDAITCKAGRLGLTNASRPGVERRKDAPKYPDDASRRAGQSAAAKQRIARDGHPRHMLGKKHTAETRQVIAEKSAATWAAMSASDRSLHTLGALKAKVARHGSVNPQKARGSWKAGWRDIGGKRHYFRSRWEANYARYLEWLKIRGDIVDWEYEPETFWFETIKRGVRSYLPDFRVHELNGTKLLHEVKGWMDARSRTTLKRMAKYYPEQKIILIREKEYRALSRFAALIGEWE
jgi:hypothetical protein